MERIVKYPTEKLISKKDLYKIITLQSKDLISNYYSFIVHYLVPTYRQCLVKYMKDLQAGIKRASF